MRQGIHLRPVRLPRLLVVAAAAASVGGCAFFDPYVSMKPLKTEAAERDKVPFAGGANQAIEQVEAVRQDYFSGMRQIGVTRATFATGATLITGYALYNALKPNPPGLTDPTFETKRTTVALGAVLATSLGLSEYALNKGQESAYNVGYQALTCLLRQSAPLLMPQSAPAGTKQADNLQDLEQAIATLSTQIDKLSRDVASARIGVAEGQALAALAQAQAVARLIAANDALPDKPGSAVKSDKAKKAGPAQEGRKKLSPEELSEEIGRLKVALPEGVQNRPYLPRTIRDVDKALHYARRTLEDGKSLRQAVVGSGESIRDRAHTIITTVNDLIRVAQPDLKKADVSLSEAQDVVSGFKKIGNDTAEDQPDANGGSTTSSLPHALGESKFAMVAPHVSERWAMPGGPGVLMMGSSLAAVVAANAVAAQPAASAASAPTDAASAPKRAPAPAPKSAPVKPPAPASAKLTTEELEKLQDLIETTLKQAKQRQAEEARQKLVDGYKSKIEDLAKPREVCRGDAAAPRCDTESLARRIEDLYAARRAVAAMVLHFRAQTKAVRRIAGCPSDSGIRVTPNESFAANAGETYSFVVTQPNPGSPVAMLQGELGDDVASLTTTSLGTAGMQAKVQFGKKAKGRYILQATDSTGDFSESVQIFVKAAPKAKDDPADKPKPAASAAGDS